MNEPKDIYTKLIEILYYSKMDNGDQTDYFTTELEKLIYERQKELEERDAPPKYLMLKLNRRVNPLICRGCGKKSESIGEAWAHTQECKKSPGEIKYAIDGTLMTEEDGIKHDFIGETTPSERDEKCPTHGHIFRENICIHCGVPEVKLYPERFEKASESKKITFAHCSVCGQATSYFICADCNLKNMAKAQERDKSEEE